METKTVPCHSSLRSSVYLGPLRGDDLPVQHPPPSRWDTGPTVRVGVGPSKIYEGGHASHGPVVHRRGPSHCPFPSRSVPYLQEVPSLPGLRPLSFLFTPTPPSYRFLGLLLLRTGDWTSSTVSVTKPRWVVTSGESNVEHHGRHPKKKKKEVRPSY